MNLKAFITISLLLLCTQAMAAKKEFSSPLIEEALSLADRADAIEALEAAVQTSSVQSDEEQTLVMLHAGEQRRLTGDLKMARAWFKEVIKTAENDALKAAAELGMALTLVAQEPEESLVTLKKTAERHALDTQNADRYLVLAQHAAKNEQSSTLRDVSRKALQYGASDRSVADRIQARLDALNSGDHSEAAMPVSPTGTNPIAQAEAAFYQGNLELADSLLKTILEVSLDTEQTAAQFLQRRMNEDFKLQPDKIGVLLPLSGKYEAAGRQVRQSLELGFSDQATTRTLVFKDSGSGAETATAAIEDLVLKEGVIAVIGPLLTDETEAVVKAAEALRIPLVSLSQAMDTPEEHEWVVQAMMTPQHQADRLGRYLMETLGMSTFAIFAPDSNYGRKAATLFTEYVQEHGGSITVHETYDTTATDLVPFAQTLGRKDYEGRKREFIELKRKAQNTNANPNRVVLPPVIDFEALFIPDSASRLPLACAALAYEEFPMGDFQTTKDGPIIPLVGLSSWNNSSLITAGGPYTRGSFFTDVFITQPTKKEPEEATSDDSPQAEPTAEAETETVELDPKTDFISYYRAKIGRTPTAREAIIYDAGALIGQAALSEASTPAHFLTAIYGVEVEGSVTGAQRFDPQTQSIALDIRVLTITRDAIVEASLEPPLDEEQVIEPSEQSTEQEVSVPE